MTGVRHISWSLLWGLPEPLPYLQPESTDNPPLARYRAGTKIPAAIGTPRPAGPDGGGAWRQAPNGGDDVTPQEGLDPWREDALPGVSHRLDPALCHWSSHSFPEKKRVNSLPEVLQGCWLRIGTITFRCRYTVGAGWCFPARNLFTGPGIDYTDPSYLHVPVRSERLRRRDVVGLCVQDA